MRQFSINFLSKFYSAQADIEKSVEKTHHDFLCQGNSILNNKRTKLMRRLLGKNLTYINSFKKIEDLYLFPTTSLTRNHLMTPSLDSSSQIHLFKNKNLHADVSDHCQNAKKVNIRYSNYQHYNEDILNEKINEFNFNQSNIRNKIMINEISTSAKLIKKIAEIKYNDRNLHDDDLEYLDKNFEEINTNIRNEEKVQTDSLLKEPRIKTQNSKKHPQNHAFNKRNKINVRFISDNVDSVLKFSIPGLRSSFRKNFIIRKGNKLYPLKTHRIISEDLSPDSKFRITQYKNNKEISPWKID